MTARRIDGVAGLRRWVGQHLGYSDWLEMTRTRAEQFDASVAGGLEPEATAASQFLTLSLTPVLLPQVVEVGGFSMGVNYGCSRVRFITPVGIGEHVRMGVELLAAEPVTGGVEISYRLTFEIQGAEEPGCVADVVFRLYL